MSLAFERHGSGTAVVLLHAGVVDSRIWDKLVPLLAVRHLVVTYDQRGYGRSPTWEGPYSPVDDLVSVLDEAGVDRAALVGLSRGGRIALSAALEAPDRISALVLVASALPGHPLRIEGTPEQEARWAAAEERGDLDELVELDLELWAPAGVDDELRTIFRENAAASNADDPATPEPDVKSRLGEIAVPTLVVTGGRDLAAIAEACGLIASGVPGARQVEIPEADHLVPWRAPERLAELVDEFVP